MLFRQTKILILYSQKFRGTKCSKFRKMEKRATFLTLHVSLPHSLGGGTELYAPAPGPLLAITPGGPRVRRAWLLTPDIPPPPDAPDPTPDPTPDPSPDPEPTPALLEWLAPPPPPPEEEDWFGRSWIRVAFHLKGILALYWASTSTRSPTLGRVPRIQLEWGREGVSERERERGGRFCILN